MAQWIRRGDNGALDNVWMLDQRALNFKRADAIVGCLENIIGAADKREIAFGVTLHHVASAINRAFERKQIAIITLVAGHQRSWRRIERQAKLAFIGVYIFCWRATPWRSLALC